MTDVQGIPDEVLERAIRAAETALLGRVFAVTQTRQREYLRDAVTAALVEVETSIRAQALREYAAEVNNRSNGPELIAAADKYAGYYSGLRAAMQNEELVLRHRADCIEAGESQ